MRTVVFPPAGAHGFGRSRTVGVVARPLSAVEANSIGVELNQQRIPVAVSVSAGHVIHLWPWIRVDTVDEVRALRAFADRTDARLVWHKALAS